MKKLFGQIALVLSMICFGNAFAQQSAGFQIHNNQCRETSGTNQAVCWKPMRHQPGGKMEFPVDGNYWHKMLNVTRSLAIFISNDVTGVQNTQYLGLVEGRHLYKETTCLNGSCNKPIHLFIDNGHQM